VQYDKIVFREFVIIFNFL